MNRPDRRAFVSGTSVLVLVLFLGVAAVQIAMNWSRPGMNAGVAATFVVFPVILAVGIGGLVYLLSKKSAGAANTGFVIVLCLGILGRLVQMSGVLPAGASARNGFQGTASASGDKSAEGLSRMADQLKRQNESLGQQLSRANEEDRRLQEKAAEQARAASESLRSKMNQPPPRPAPLTPAPGSPAPNPPGVAPRSSPASIPAAPRSTPVIPAAEDPGTQRILDGLGSEMDKEIDAMFAQPPALLARLSKPPARDLVDIKKRIDEATKLRDSVAELSKKLSGLGDEAQKRLEAAGVSHAMGPAMQFASKYGAMPRSFACDRLVRMLDSAKEEGEILRDNLGKWVIGKDGKVTSKDFAIQSKAGSARFMLEAELAQRAKIIEDIKGK